MIRRIAVAVLLLQMTGCSSCVADDKKEGAVVSHGGRSIANGGGGPVKLNAKPMRGLPGIDADVPDAGP